MAAPFPKVKNYDPEIPVLKFSFPRLKWFILFIYDQFFGFSLKNKNSQGEVLKRIDAPTKTGSMFRSTHQKTVKKLLSEKNRVSYDGTLPLPEIDAKDLTVKDFRRWRRKVNTPLVIRGYLQGAPVLDMLSKDSLASTHGDTMVTCVKDVEEKKGVSRIGQNVGLHSVKLKDFMESDEYDEYYVNNFYGLLNNSDFLNLCKGKEIEEMQGKENVLSQWFISRKHNQGSTLHCAMGENVFLNIRGKKEWHFIHPSYSALMQANMSRYGLYSTSEITESIEGDFYQQTVAKYDYFKKVPIYKTVLNEGDILLNPPWWWHTVRNTTPFTVGCATRWFDARYSVTNNITFYTGALVEMIKNPKKSTIYVSLKALKDKRNADQFLSSVFSGNDNK